MEIVHWKHIKPAFDERGIKVPCPERGHQERRFYALLRMCEVGRAEFAAAVDMNLDRYIHRHEDVPLWRTAQVIVESQLGVFARTPQKEQAA